MPLAIILLPDVMGFFIPVVFIVVGLLTAVFGGKAGEPQQRTFTKVFGLFFAGFAALFLLLISWMVAVRTYRIGKVTRLDAAEVASVHVGPKEITDPDHLRRIVEALKGAEAYYPNHGNYADDLTMRVCMKSGSHDTFQVAWSYEKPGAVLDFYSGDPDGAQTNHGEAFCKDLPAALDEAGLRLPRIKGYRVDDSFTPDTVSEIQMGKKAVTSANDIDKVLDALKKSQIGYYRGHEGLGLPLDIVIVSSEGTYRLQAARRLGDNGAVFWFCSDDGHGGLIPHGHCLSERLPHLLDGLAAPLP